MISQSKGKRKLTYGGESENTGDPMKNTSSSSKFPSLSQVRTAKFKILQILTLSHPPQYATTDATAFCKLKKGFLILLRTKSRRFFVVLTEWPSEG